LSYARRDYIVIAVSLILLATSVAANLSGLGRFWAP